MGRGAIVSLSLFILPIAITLGLLIGLDAVRSNDGQAPLFPPGSNPAPGGFGLGGGGGDKLTSELFCQKATGVTPSTKGQQYTLNPNQWGWNEGDPGALCMNVTVYNNGTYPSKTMAPEWSITWQYPQSSDSNLPVHAFSNIKLDDTKQMPAQLSSISSLALNLEWNYFVGDTPTTTTPDPAAISAAMTAADVNANVAIDMFIDPDSSKSKDTDNAKFEVMVWFGQFGDSTFPVGWQTGPRTTQTINGTTFNLYFGDNANDQTVATWLTPTPITNFVGDIVPLLQQDLTAYNGPAATDYLGYFAFGSEAYWSPANVTFSNTHLEVQLVTS